MRRTGSTKGIEEWSEKWRGKQEKTLLGVRWGAGETRRPESRRGKARELDTAKGGGESA